MPKEKEVRVQEPTVTHELYNGQVIIDFYEKFVTRGHAYNHVYINRENGEWPVSVTGASGMVDKSGPLGFWQERLSREDLLKNLGSVKIKELIATLSKADPKAIEKGFATSNENRLKYLAAVIKTSPKKAIEITEAEILKATSLYRVKKEEGASIGDRVHTWIKNWSAGLNPNMPTDPLILNGVSAFLRWFKELEVEIVKHDQIVYSKKHDYVGSYDLLARLKLPGYGNKKFICITDYKTNNWSVDKKTGLRKSVVHDEQRYQFSGYKGAYEEEFGKDTTGPRIMVAFDKETGEFDWHIIEDHEKDFPCFLAGLTLKKRAKELAKGW